ncbi:MAG: DnaJ domain-containing protein [Alphaproteobacteria bacterium]|jgi:hypothetical protein
MGRPKSSVRFESRPSEPPARLCDMPGCTNAGEYRAPKDRTLSDYYWFCLEHVREYNARWNYYEGMTAEEIERHVRHDVVWQRPTWKLGELHSQMRHYVDPLGILKDAFPEEGSDGRDSPPPTPVEPALAAAARILEVTFPLELKQVRLNYKRLAKSYHPDSNGGNKTSEEKFKDITEAYRLIMSVLK